MGRRGGPRVLGVDWMAGDFWGSLGCLFVCVGVGCCVECCSDFVCEAVAGFFCVRAALELESAGAGLVGSLVGLRVVREVGRARAGLGVVQRWMRVVV